VITSTDGPEELSSLVPAVPSGSSGGDEPTGVGGDGVEGIGSGGLADGNGGGDVKGGGEALGGDGKGADGGEVGGSFGGGGATVKVYDPIGVAGCDTTAEATLTRSAVLMSVTGDRANRSAACIGAADEFASL